MKFSKFSQNFTVYYGILLRFCSTSIIVNFWLCFRSFQKFTTKFRSILKWFKNFEISDLAMAKVEKVNIAYTY